MDFLNYELFEPKIKMKTFSIDYFCESWRFVVETLTTKSQLRLRRRIRLNFVINQYKQNDFMEHPNSQNSEPRIKFTEFWIENVKKDIKLLTALEDIKPVVT